MFAVPSTSQGPPVAAGLDSAANANNRADRGCTACRRKKKKCDLQKPRCFRCRNSTSRSVCEWPDPNPAATRKSSSIKRADNVNTTASTKEPRVARRSLSSPAAAATPVSTITAVATPPTTPGIIPNVAPHPRLYELCRSEAMVEALRLTPSEPIHHPSIKGAEHLTVHRREFPIEDLPALIQNFEDAVLDPYKSGQAIAVLSLTLAMDHPPLLHGWLACAGLPYAYREPSLRPIFLMHYNEAVRGISATLSKGPCKGEEWMQATILALHLFEEHQSSDDVFEPRQSHIQGAHILFRDSLSARPSITRHQLLLLEAYIFRTAVNCLCDAHLQLPYDHLEGPMQVLRWGTQTRQRPVYEACPWVGRTGMTLCNVMYRVSWLIARRSSSRVGHSTDGMSNELQISSQLAHGERLVEETWPDAQEAAPPLPDPIRRLRWSILLACKLLLAVLRNDSPLEVATISSRGITVFSTMLETDTPSPLSTWSLAMLGTGCPKTLRGKCSHILAVMKESHSPGSVSRVERLFATAWSVDSELGQGASVLMDPRVTSEVFF